MRDPPEMGRREREEAEAEAEGGRRVGMDQDFMQDMSAELARA